MSQECKVHRWRNWYGGTQCRKCFKSVGPEYLTEMEAKVRELEKTIENAIIYGIEHALVMKNPNYPKGQP